VQAIASSRSRTFSKIVLAGRQKSKPDWRARETRALPKAVKFAMLPAMTSQVLSEKVGVVFGVANKRSIAWAIAKAWAGAGARLIFNYQGERLKENVEELVGEFGENVPLFPCDVSSDEEIAKFFREVRGQTDRLDLLLHSVAFAPKEALEGEFVNTTREAFRTAHDISAYSLVALAREAALFMTNGGSILAMTYYGSEKVVPHYNVMGVAKASLEASTRYLAYDLGPKKIRVNCISAGPVNTLAARGISGFMSMLKHYQERAPLKRSCDPTELGATGVFLASDGAAGITGQVIYVDGGYQIMGM
jgi:enoyl-[acyl-carrier protein] reductase I